MGAPKNPVAGVPRKGSSKSSRSRNHRAIYIFPARWAGIFFRNYLMKYHGLRDSDHVHRGLNEHVRNMGLMRRKFLILSVEHHLCAALVAKEVWDRTGFLICQWVYCAVFPFVAHSHCAQKEQYSNRARVWSWSPRPCPFLAVSNFIDQLCSFLLFLLRLELSEVATIEAGNASPLYSVLRDTETIYLIPLPHRFCNKKILGISLVHIWYGLESKTYPKSFKLVPISTHVELAHLTLRWDSPGYRG